jgi:hypothetical protein
LRVGFKRGGLYHPLPLHPACTSDGLRKVVVGSQNIIDSIIFNVAKMPPPVPPPVPLPLQPFIALNAEFKVLLCLGSGCQCVVQPAALSGHLYRKHQVRIEARKQVNEYVRQLGFNYDFQSVQLPKDGSTPQPILQVEDGFQCSHCHYFTRNRGVMRKHSNRVYDKKRVKDEEIFKAVRLQSWFREGKEQY